jgi:hypothetical protein
MVYASLLVSSQVYVMLGQSLQTQNTNFNSKRMLTAILLQLQGKVVKSEWK